MHRLFGPIEIHAFVGVQQYVLIIIILISMEWRYHIISVNCYFSSDVHVFASVILHPNASIPFDSDESFAIASESSSIEASASSWYITKDLIEHSLSVQMFGEKKKMKYE